MEKFIKKQPMKSSFETFTRKVNTILEWKKNPESYFNDLINKEINEELLNSIIEQYKKENLGLVNLIKKVLICN